MYIILFLVYDSLRIGSIEKPPTHATTWSELVKLIQLINNSTSN